MKHKKMQRCRSPATTATATTSAAAAAAAHHQQQQRYADLSDRDPVVGSSSLDDGLSLSSADDEEEAARERREDEDDPGVGQGAVTVAAAGARGTNHEERRLPGALAGFGPSEHCSSGVVLSPGVYQERTRLFSDNNTRP
ncbi:hypothetical protein SprV_0301006500 [Sparganum proliferum]